LQETGLFPHGGQQAGFPQAKWGQCPINAQTGQMKCNFTSPVIRLTGVSPPLPSRIIGDEGIYGSYWERNVSVAAVSEMKPTRPADFLKFENFWQMYLPIAASFKLNLRIMIREGKRPRWVMTI
jgi:hypothetical protein